MPGFTSSSDGINTTLGRGGSDYTAAIQERDATDLEIWLMSRIPPIQIKQAPAYCIYILSGRMELSHFELKPPTKTYKDTDNFS
jgi:aspartokinase/homoserine dehydrogenase 1